MSQSLKITSFNIRCFGANGLYTGKVGVENRLKELSAFINEELKDTDIFFLQEIMDLKFLTQILPESFHYVSYPHPYERHMFLVIAVSNKFELKNTQTLDEACVNKKTSRPPLYSKLIDRKTQKPLLNLINVHLKSAETHSKTRLKQIGVINDFIKTLSTDSDIIIGGDFNSHVKEITKKDLDDKDLFSDLFKKNNLNHIENSNCTYQTIWTKQVLDHFWISKTIIQNESLNVFKAYNYKFKISEKDSLKKYFDEISDHVPISLKFSCKG